jgi:hypothetical protein
MKFKPPDGAHSEDCAPVMVAAALIATHTSSTARMIGFMGFPPMEMIRRAPAGDE